MSSAQLDVKCPQCGYKYAFYEYTLRAGREYTMCRRCGYYELWDPKFDEDGNHCGWKHEVGTGAGALSYGTGRGGSCDKCLNTEKQVLDAARWLREALDKGQVDPDVSYLTRWNREAKRVELIVGKFYESPEIDGGGAKGEVAEPVPSSQPT
jgi:hypothetical protein